MKTYTFIKPDSNLQNNLMAFGFDVGSGWLFLIEELCDKIQDVINEHPKKYKNFEFLQVKEKFGTLRVYTSFVDKKIDKLITEYEKKSETVCEICGKDGKLIERNGWWKTVCEDHRDF